MKQVVKITKFDYEPRHVNKKTGEVTEMCTYVGAFSDNEGLTNYVKFILVGEKFRNAQVRKDDRVIVRIRLDLRQYQDNLFNNVSDCYFLAKEESSTEGESQAPAEAAEPADQNTLQPSAAEGGENKTDLPF